MLQKGNESGGMDTYLQQHPGVGSGEARSGKQCMPEETPALMGTICILRVAADWGEVVEAGSQVCGKLGLLHFGY